MPKTTPFRGPILGSIPPSVLNAAFPLIRIASQLLALLLHTLFAAPLRLLRLLRRGDPAPLAVGRVVGVSSSWAGGVPKHPRSAVFVSRLGVLGDRQKSEWVASFGGHGGVDKAGQSAAADDDALCTPRRSHAPANGAAPTPRPAKLAPRSVPLRPRRD